MVAILQHRRDTTVNRLGVTLAAGELFEDTSTTELWLGDGATVGGVAVSGNRKNTQTGTTYVVLASDSGKWLTLSNAAPVAVTLAAAASSSGAFFPAQTKLRVLNRGAGTVTITPTTSTINSAATLVLLTNQGAVIISDGVNYDAIVGAANSGTAGSLAGLTDVTLTSSVQNDLLSYDGSDWVNKKPLILLSKTTNYGVLATENGTHFNNIGAGGAVYFTLPTAAAGLFYGFLVHATQIVRVVANTGDFVAIGGTNSASAGYLESNAPFSFVSVEAHDAVQWIASSAVGSWSVN